jgi:hypothetical protein
VTGEQRQALGIEGSQRAKRWLESTCRAEVKWNNPTIGVHKLQYQKAGAASDSQATGDFFSFDLGGNMLGGEIDGENFLAECKKHSNANDQGVAYRRFVAQCYLVECGHPQWVDHFLWITWAPFSVTTWSSLLTPEYVKQSVEYDAQTKYTALGQNPYDDAIGEAVAQKLLIVVLADGQEVALSLHGDELVRVRQALLEHRSV